MYVQVRMNVQVTIFKKQNKTKQKQQEQMEECDPIQNISFCPKKKGSIREEIICFLKQNICKSHTWQLVNKKYVTHNSIIKKKN